MADGVLNQNLSNLSDAHYSNDVIDYLNNLDTQRQALADKYGAGISLDNPSFLYARQEQEPASDSYHTVYSPEEEIRGIMASGGDASSVFHPGYDVQSWGGSRDPNNFNMVRLGADNQYTFTDKTSGKTYSASTPQQVQALTQLAKSMSGMGNNTASWDITDSSGNVVANDTPYTPSFLKQAGQFIADQAPSVLASLALGPEAGWAIKGLGAGAATAAYQGAKGASLGDSLLAGLKSGATAGAMSYASPYIGGALKDAGLDFPGSDTLFPSGSSDPFSFGGGGGYSGPLPGSPGVEAVQVSAGGFPNYTGALGALGSAAAGIGATDFSSYNPQDMGEQVEVSATRPKPPPSISPDLTGLVGASTSTFANDGTEQAEVSTNRNPPDASLSDLVVPPFTSTEIDNLTNQPDPTKTNETSDLSKGLTAAKYAALLASLLGGAGAAGSGNNAGSSLYSSSLANQQKLPDIFHAALPGAGGLGGSAPGTSANRTQRNPQTDWNTYGERPELSFFDDVPQRMAHGGALPAEHDVAPRQSFAVKGDGDGRSDSIPAALSDGEYVVDAETVSLLGNGSNKAGAHQLDQFRVNLRKHKGAELAKGRFSVNAKNPQAYMAGGNT